LVSILLFPNPFYTRPGGSQKVYKYKLKKKQRHMERDDGRENPRKILNIGRGVKIESEKDPEFAMGSKCCKCNQADKLVEFYFLLV